MPAIEARGLTKVYPRGGTTALSGVDLSIPEGKVFGLIGRNGAGKTTFVRIAATQLMPTSGELYVLGSEVRKEVDAIRARIASVPQESRPLYFVTVDELVFLYLRMRGMEARESRIRTNAVLEELGLTAVRRKQVSRLSGGMRRRAMVAMVFASDAEVLFLDEPTTGLDPLARREVWGAIRRAQAEKRTVVLTTHYLDEAEALSANLALLDNGVVKLEGTPSEIRGRVKRPFRVTVQAILPREEVETFGEVSNVDGSYLVFTTEREARELTLRALSKGAQVSMGPVSLEDIFLQVVGKRLDEDAPLPEAA